MNDDMHLAGRASEEHRRLTRRVAAVDHHGRGVLAMPRSFSVAA
jgi:hypothetical protein